MRLQVLMTSGVQDFSQLNRSLVYFTLGFFDTRIVGQKTHSNSQEPERTTTSTRNTETPSVELKDPQPEEKMFYCSNFPLRLS